MARVVGMIILSLCLLQVSDACWGGGGSGTTTTTPPPILPCSCGTSTLTRSAFERIVGGVNALATEVPWQAALERRRIFRKYKFCGGVILSSRTVLTAAHCIDSRSFSVVVGQSTELDPRISARVAKTEIHPNNSGFDYDFAIITLASDLTFSDRVRPVCLPTDSALDEDRLSLVSGWGTLESGGALPQNLQKVNVTTTSNSVCIASSLYNSSQITGNMLCAAAPGKDSCQGDSGGPLVTMESGKFYLTGLVSFGYDCAEANAPGVYARVSAALSWINPRITGSVCAS